MNTFHDLFRLPTRPPSTANFLDRRRELFPGFVERSPRLHLWSPDQLIPDRGPRLLIGAATWSGYDLNLLDLIEEAPVVGIRVDVFDVDSLTNEDDFQRYIPGLVHAFQTPFVGYWVDGRLVESATGFHGRQLVVRVCGLPTWEVESRMNTVISRT